MEEPPRTALAIDPALIELCKRGDLSGYERVYRLLGPRLRSLAWNMLGSPTDADDAVQETFLKVFRSISNIRADATFTTWVFRILVNTCRDMLRARNARGENNAPDVNGMEEVFFRSRAADPSLRHSIETALRLLNPRHREVFLMAEVEGLKHAEIAGILDIPVGTSKSWLFEAKRALQSHLTIRKEPQS